MDEKILGRTRRSVLAASAAGAALSVLAEPNTAEAIETGGSSAIRPFQVNVPQADLDDLRRRVLATRFSEPETVVGFTQGTPFSTLQKLVRYWGTEYDWRRAEAEFNRYPQFITEIDGIDIHFVHARSRHPNALPMIICHGWPGSIVEQLKVIGPLTDPTAYGGRASEAFDVIVPSMPGYGYSGKPAETGWGPERMARAYITLMKRLGYNRFVAQGGDWGAIVVDFMALEGAPELIGIHTNMAGAIPPEIDAAAARGAPAPAGLNAEERACYDQLAFSYTRIAYAQISGTRPQTLAGLADSPAGLAAFMLDHDARSLEMIARSFDGVREGLTPDDVLDNITHFWLTNTGVSAVRLYWEYKGSYFAPKGVTIPVAVSVFPDELYTPTRDWAQRAYPNLIHYNRLERGGHFAAWEQPELFTSELRAAFRSLRRTA